MNPKDTYNILYKLLKETEGNKASHRIASLIKTKLTKAFKQWMSDSRFIKAEDSSIDPTLLTRESLLNKLKQKVMTAPDDKTFLALSQELNKMEDNYKGKTDPVINITVINYADAHVPEAVEPKL